MTTQVPRNAERQFGEPNVEILTLEPPKPEAPSAAGLANSAPNPVRCQYRYQNATQCRLRAADSESGLCARHLRQKFAAILPSFPDDSADLSKDLIPEGFRFSNADSLRQYLTRLLFLMTEGRISPRRASVMAYVTIQLLHAHAAAEKEEDNQPFTFDLPRPEHD